jgi:hypothetical protein
LPDRADVDWSSVVVTEPHPSGKAIRHGTLYAADRPSEEDVTNLLPEDGEMHLVTLDFRGADGYRVAAKTDEMLIANAPAREPAAIELAREQPTFRVMDAFESTQAMNLKLVEHMMTDARLARAEAAEMRRAELELLRDMHAQTAETLAKVEGARAQDPMAEMAKMAIPAAKTAGAWLLAKAAGFVDESGGVKDAAAAVATAVGGAAPAGPSAVEVIGPLIDKGIMLVANRMNVMAQKAKAEAQKAAAEAEARKAEAELAAAEVRARAAEVSTQT